MDGLLALPYWRCKPYVRPTPDASQVHRKRPGETMDQNRRRKMQKAQRIAKYHEKVLNKVNNFI